MLQKLPERRLEQLVVSELRLPEHGKYGLCRLREHWKRREWLQLRKRWKRRRLRLYREYRERWKLRLYRKRWKQRRLREYWKYRKLRLHREWRLLDGGVLQRSVVDHPVPGRKIRVQDGITETKRRAGGCASPCLLHMVRKPGRKTAGEKRRFL